MLNTGTTNCSHTETLSLAKNIELQYYWAAHTPGSEGFWWVRCGLLGSELHHKCWLGFQVLDEADLHSAIHFNSFKQIPRKLHPRNYREQAPTNKTHMTNAERRHWSWDLQYPKPQTLHGEAGNTREAIQEILEKWVWHHSWSPKLINSSC